MTVAPVTSYAVLSDSAVVRHRALIVMSALVLAAVSIGVACTAPEVAEWIASFKIGGALLGQLMLPFGALVVIGVGGFGFTAFFVSEAFRRLRLLVALDSYGLRELAKCLENSPSDELFAKEIKRAVANNETLRYREIENAQLRKRLIDEAAYHHESVARMTKALASLPSTD